MALISCGPLDELSGTKVDTVGQVPFENRLAVPPLADSELDSEGRRVFTLTAESGESELRPGEETETWGFNGSHLGPTLRASRGEEVVVDVRNRLDEATTVHWHGMHLPAAADGGPHQVVEPGASWTPSWEIDQPAATLWYHPHPHGDTEKHVYRGLAGLFILDDAEEAELDLPREYGVDDVPVIVQDKRFADEGSLIEDERERLGILGDTLLVNGTYGPYDARPAGRPRRGAGRAGAAFHRVRAAPRGAGVHGQGGKPRGQGDCPRAAGRRQSVGAPALAT